MTDTTPGPGRLRRSGRLFGGTLILAVIIVGAVYGMSRLGGKEAAAECNATVKLAGRLDPLAHGEVAAFSVAKTPQTMPPLTFSAADGTKVSLADFKGRIVLFNLWATWCVPCRQEMAALDQLQAKLGGPTFSVVAVNIDTARLDKPKRFLADAGVKSLTFYADPSAEVFEKLRSAGKVVGLPTSFLLDRQGCEIGTMAGGADWSSEEAVALVRAGLGS